MMLVMLRNKSSALLAARCAGLNAMSELLERGTLTVPADLMFALGICLVC